ncbi:MAG: hypothetical protein Phyf2KO_06400 [Phycisphaerales bacterium]
MSSQQGHNAAAFRCAYCNYDLSGTRIGDKCPECGNIVNFRSVPMYQSNGAAVASLVLGIVSIVGCFMYGVISIICGPLAIYFSGKAKRAIQAGNADPNSMGMATAGRVCGIIGTCLGSIGVLFLLFYLALMIIAVISAGAGAGP